MILKKLMEIDSTSGRERELADWIESSFEAPKKERFNLADGSANLLFSWGKPRVVFCTHIDTVPPYIAPSIEGGWVRGRGACDAKGQIAAMYEACKILEQSGESGFALLLLSGEETGSIGAKAFAKTEFRAPYLVVGEPTDNYMVSASKGTRSYSLRFKGEAFHSGYPQYGHSAVSGFIDFMNRLSDYNFANDPLLGETSWNVGRLSSDNPQNILSPLLCCQLYFRTTFAAAQQVEDFMAQSGVLAERRGGDEPARYMTIEGFPTKVVSFGSDAPHLTNFEHKMICGPGSITVAHRDDECIEYAALDKAVRNYLDIFAHCKA